MNAGPSPSCGELSADLDWLEDHARDRADASESLLPLRFAAALVRNLICPNLAKPSASPLHVAVLGGAGTGKSTITNLICGAVVAEANPQAGFTRHPIAYVAQSQVAAWFTSTNPLPRLHRQQDASGSDVDEDIFQVRGVAPGPGDQLLDRYVIWDCPDMTTAAAAEYAPRLLEVAALADAIIYVASDERYNDAVPTNYLRLFITADKPIIVVLTKMRAEQAASLIDHFRKEVLGKLPPGRVAILSVPHLTPEERANPASAGAYRIPLVNQLMVLADVPEQMRRRSLETATQYLRTSQHELLAVAKNDVAAMEDWSKLVVAGQAEFEDRYRREFLTSAKFDRFDEALVRLIDLLELPGVGKYVANALYVVRTPFRLLKGFLGKVFPTPVAAEIPEQPVLDTAFGAWMDRVRATSLAQRSRHDLWNRVAQGFEHGLGDEARERFRTGLREFQAGQTDEIDRTARAIYEDLEKSPNALNTLRGAKFAADVASIGAAVVMGGVSVYDVIWVPLAASMSQQLTEWIGAGYVETQRERARQRQRELVNRFLSHPIGTWLGHWPLTGGTPYERLRLVLTRVPQAIAAISAQVEGPPA